MSSQITAWTDPKKKAEVLQSYELVWYYAVNATDASERRYWINELIKRAEKDGQSNN